ncbi:Protein ANTAGONIST OF LIKE HETEROCHROMATIN PROTEIN 1 [Frankliniella fusca]|uniref:Protein ANTAGONIST OF LIKE HETEROCHROMATIN PROTEIN 1 n=1 Tax=Frankliniella fusca TaxID=407009 RepID=A0AAE1GYU7_9NEOP|nr:Protein ANTAGONIST OF LIKE HETEROCHROMATIN PROTEIN 1 [Frankliniella fusca]
MNRTTFERLLVAVGDHLDQMGRMVQPRTPLDLKLMMSLWIMATQETFQSEAVKFSVPSRGTVHYHYVSIIHALREMAPKYIQWPNMFERDNIKAYFERRYFYLGVVGCIDCSHIFITAPLIQPKRYVNRFQKYSVHLQAVCDHRRVFRDIYIGKPGSVNDSRVLQWSPLGHSLLHDNDNGQHQPLAAQVDSQNDYPDGAVARHDDVGPGNVDENVDDPDNGDENEENVDDPNNVNDNVGNTEVIIPDFDPLLGPAMRAGQLKRDYISFLLHPPINED